MVDTGAACSDREDPLYVQMLKCVRCGKCREVCPVLDVLSPGTPGWEVFGSRGRVNLALGLEEGEIPTNDLLVEAQYTCFFCNNCVEECPSSVKVTEIIQNSRARIFREGKAPNPVVAMGEQITETDNIFGMDDEDRMIWAFDVEDVVEGRLNRKAQVLYFVGCQGTFKGSLADTPVGMVNLLERAGVDYTLLGEEEVCCGNPYYLGGDGEHFEQQARKVIARVQDVGAKKVVFTCPGCYNTISKYPKVLGTPLPFEIQFATDFLLELTEAGKLKFGAAPEDLGTVTYHDACELGRHQGIYESPRELLKAIPGLNFKEMEDNREHAKCCGGGGLVGAAYPEYREGQGGRKIQEFRDNEVDSAVTACYACNDTLSAATAKDERENPERRVRIVDIFKLLGDCVE
ncbi:MAG: (Fe-S)-binding protein [Promethearchaeota archaeon]